MVCGVGKCSDLLFSLLRSIGFLSFLVAFWNDFGSTLVCHVVVFGRRNHTAMVISYLVVDSSPIWCLLGLTARTSNSRVLWGSGCHHVGRVGTAFWLRFAVLIVSIHRICFVLFVLGWFRIWKVLWNGSTCVVGRRNHNAMVVSSSILPARALLACESVLNE